MQLSKKKKIHFLDDEMWSEGVYRRINYYKKKFIKKNKISLMLTGGNTAKDLYNSWNKKRIFKKNYLKIYFTDERCVGPKSKYSNYFLIKKYLLDTKVVKSDEVYRIESEKKLKDNVIKKYAKTLPSSIDILFLSLAPDGHIASIFPNSRLMNEKRKLVGITEKKIKGFYRISISPLIIKQAKLIFIFVKGRERGKLLAMNNKKINSDLPFNIIEHGIWFLDKSASKAYKSSI